METKTLYFIRHAKSSWDDPLASDHDRLLNERGVKDAHTMAESLISNFKSPLFYPPPDLLLSSTAVRARSTAQIFCKEFGLTGDNIKLDGSLYMAGITDLEEVIFSLKESFRSVMIFFHNPLITYALNNVKDVNINNMPTCGAGVIKCHIDAWREFKWGHCELIDMDYPKKKTKPGDSL